MPFVRHQSHPEARPGHDAASRPGALWRDLIVLAGLAMLLGAVIAVGRAWAAPRPAEEPIDLSFLALPRYALFSLSRGLLAYVLSLAFTVVVGTLVARSGTAEKIILPALDVLQSIPVLSFLPGLVLGLVAVFPRSHVGLELACVLAIFTGQVWNMTFSYCSSVRALPAELLEVAALHHFGSGKRLLLLELPGAMVGLVWNSMMSMAGGWFFLSVVESFRLEGKPYRLPGLGSYMAAAVEEGDLVAAAWGVLAMSAVILLVDLVLWRPLVVWADRFRLDETNARHQPRSMVFELLRRLGLLPWRREASRPGTRNGAARGPWHLPGPEGRVPAGDGEEPGASGAPTSPPTAARLLHLLRRTAPKLALAGLAVFLLLGGKHLAWLLAPVNLTTWLEILRALGWTALRVAAALLVGAAWTIPVGLALGSSPHLARRFQPLIQLAASFPAPMLFPFLAPWLRSLGLGPNVVAVTLLLVGTQWYLLFNVVAGAQALPQDLREAADANGLGGARKLLLLDLPGCFPYLLTGLITAAGGAWNASIVSELVHSPRGDLFVEGIGSLIARSFDSGNDACLAACTVALSLALALLNHFGWRRLYRLSDERFAMNR